MSNPLSHREQDQQSKQNQANRDLAAAIPQSGESNRIADQESVTSVQDGRLRDHGVKVSKSREGIAIGDQNTVEPGTVREWILSAAQIKLVTAAQAEVRQVLPAMPSGIASEITALLAAIDNHLQSDPPSATAIRSNLSQIGERVRLESPEMDLLHADHIGRHIELVLVSLGTNLQRETT